MSIKEIAEYLCEKRSPVLQANALADILDRIRWMIPPNEDKLLEEVRNAWMNGDDEFKIEVALLMDEVFPAASRTDLHEAMNRISDRFPKLKGLCEGWISRWDEQFGVEDA